MIELYLMLLLCLIIALFIGFLAVTAYMGWVLICKDLEERRKENEASIDGNDY